MQALRHKAQIAKLENQEIALDPGRQGMIFSVLLLLGTAVSCSGSRFNPEDNMHIAKGDQVVEGGFFDASSMDLENHFFSFLLSNHTVFKSPLIPFSLSTSLLADQNSELLDMKLLEGCTKINSHWKSGGLSNEDIKPILEAFWEESGLFKWIQFDEQSNEWIEADEPEIVELVEAEVIKTVDKPKSKNHKKNRNKNKKNKNKAGITAYMRPDLESFRLTMFSPVCQRTLSIALTFLSPEQCATLFRNVPIELIADPEILANVPDYSGFKDEGSVAKLAAILGSGKWFFINEQMIKGLPFRALHRVVEARNFDISFMELNCFLSNRPGFELEEPFASDNRTFRLFCADELFSPLLPPVESFLNGSNVSIENVLAYYVHSENFVNGGLSVILKMWKESQLDAATMFSVSADFKSKSAFVFLNLKTIFGEREKLIAGLKAKNVCNEKLEKLLRVSMNETVELFIKKELDVNSVWHGILTEVFDSDTLRAPYTVESVMTEGFGLWNEIIAEENVSDQFKNGRWTRNLLLILMDSLSALEGKAELKEQAEAILRRHMVLKPVGLEYGDYDWFLLDIKEITNETVLTEDKKQMLHLEFRTTRALKRVLWEVCFNSDEIIEAIWQDEDAMMALVYYTDCLSQGHVDSLVLTDIGNELLRANPGLLNRLPTYANFSLDDMKRLNFRLDGGAVAIGTLGVETAKAWLKQEEFLVNSGVRSLYHVHMVIFDPESWPLVNFESFSVDYNLSQELAIVDKLKISHLIAGDNVADILSLVARWMIHVDMQHTWTLLLSRLSRFPQIIRISSVFITLENSETSKIIVQLKKVFKELQGGEERKLMHELMTILKTRFISTFKFIMRDVDVQAVKAQLVKDNEFIVSLIQKGNGSERFKRVWTDRARLLLIPDNDKISATTTTTTTTTTDNATATDNNLLPLDDALFKWFTLNRIELEKMRIKACLNIKMKKPVEFMGEDELDAFWFNALIRYEVPK